MKNQNPIVSIVMGSDSDFEVMQEAGKVLDAFGVAYEYQVTSAHRSPDHAIQFAKNASSRGIKILIAGASYSAHLPGVLAANSILPVIGIPLDASPLKGIDALFSMGQMPPGIPVATVTVGKAGTKNAALFAIEILATHDEKLANQLIQYRKELADSVISKNEKLRKR